MKLSSEQLKKYLLNLMDVSIDEIAFETCFKDLNDFFNEISHETNSSITEENITNFYNIWHLATSIVKLHFDKKYIPLGIKILEKIKDFSSLAEIYFEGIVVEQNIDLGLDYLYKYIKDCDGYDFGENNSSETYLEKYANIGNARAQYLLGYFNYCGYRKCDSNDKFVFIKNKTRASYWLNLAIKLKYFEAFKLKADIELHRNKLYAAYKYLLKYYKFLVGNKFDFKLKLTHEYIYNFAYNLILTEFEEKFAIECLEFIANEGYKPSQKLLSEFYMNGIIVRRNKKSSLYWHNLYNQNKSPN